MSETRWTWEVLKLDERGDPTVLVAGHRETEAAAKSIAGAKLVSLDADQANVWKQVRVELEPGLYDWDTAPDDLGTQVGVRWLLDDPSKVTWG